MTPLSSRRLDGGVPVLAYSRCVKPPRPKRCQASDTPKIGCADQGSLLPRRACGGWPPRCESLRRGVSARSATPACRGPGSGSLPGRGTGTASPLLPFPLFLLAALLLLPFSTVTSAAPATSAKRPKTAKDIKWPKPSQKPGTVTFKSNRPTEREWAPVLQRFRAETGPAFDAMIQLAEQSAQQLKAPRTWRTTYPSPPEPAKAGQDVKDRENVGGGTTRRPPEPAHGPQKPASTSVPAPTATPPLLKAIDIVRIPILTGEKLDAKLNTLRRQLNTMEAQGYDTAVWEITDLPPAEDLDEWSGKCFAGFPRPPILMLGWHISKGKILPSPASMRAFLQGCGARCHSVMHTGEELNAQFYAEPDGGEALPFFAYWIGIIRKASPDNFVWARIDEVLHRKNSRQSAWLEALLPISDGVIYQVAHGTSSTRRGVSSQFKELRTQKARLEKQSGPTPLLLGGFSLNAVSPTDAGRAAAALQPYGEWLRKQRLQGHVRFVGYLPSDPRSQLLGPADVHGPLPQERASRE